MPAVSTNHHLARRIRIGTIATLATAGLLLLAPSASSQTVTPQSVDPLQHFIDCAGVLITAPDIHAANCLPSNVAPDTKSLAADSAGGDDCKGQDDVDDAFDDVDDAFQVDLDSDCRYDDTDNYTPPD